MKKILSLMLIICMLLSTCVLFSSCSKVNEKKFEENPQEVLNNAIDKVSSDFFSTDTKANKIIAKALQKGSVTLTIESDTLKDEAGVGKIAITEYVDAENKKAVADILVNVNDQDLGGKLFVDKNGIIVQSNDILGSDTAYLLSPASISAKFLDSDWAKLLGISGGNTSTAVTEMITKLGDIYKKAFEATEESAAADINALLATLKPAVAEEKVEINGKEVNCLTVTYTISNETVRAYMNQAVKNAGMTDETTLAGIKDAMDEMDKEGAINLNAKILINKKSGALAKVLIDGTVTEKRVISRNLSTKEETIEEHIATVNGELALSDTEIALTINAAQDGESGVAALKLTKTEDGDNIVYKLAITSKEGEEATQEIGTVIYTTNDKNGDFSITASGEELVGEKSFSISGNVTADDKTATISIKSVKYGETAIELKTLSLKFDSAAELPATPATPTDFVDMNTEAINAFMETFQNSKLFKMISGIN